jgi:hypothetical protein
LIAVPLTAVAGHKKKELSIKQQSNNVTTALFKYTILHPPLSANFIKY